MIRRNIKVPKVSLKQKGISSATMNRRRVNLIPIINRKMVPKSPKAIPSSLRTLMITATQVNLKFNNLSQDVAPLNLMMPRVISLQMVKCY